MAEIGDLRFDNGCHYTGEIETGKANGYGSCIRKRTAFDTVRFAI